MSKKTYWIIATALFAISIAFHSLNLDFASYELDEAVHIWYAQKPYAKVIEHASNDPNPPVFNLAISTWIKAFGVGEISTRFFSALMASLAVLALFLVGSRNFGLTTGVFAALFLCFSPILFRFTHLARPYTLMMFTVVLSYGALFEHIKKSGRWTFVAYWLATALMIYAHPTSIFNVAAQFLIILLYSKNEWKNVFSSVVPLGLALLTFAVWVLAIPFFEESHRMWFGPPNWDAIVNVLRMFYSSNTLMYVQLGLLALILISGYGRKQRLANYIGILAVACWVIIPFTASIAFSHMIKPIFQDKYILSVQPGMMLLLAVSIGEVVKWNWLRIAGSGLVVLILSTSVKLQPPPYGGDWKGLVEYIRPKLNRKTAVFVAPGYEYRTFAYYFNRSYYQDYKQTVGLLAKDHVYTSWNDIIDVESGKSSYDKIYTIYAHWGFVPSGIPQGHIDSLIWLAEERQFPAIKLRVYTTSLNFSNDTVISQKASMEGLSDSMIKLNRDFSPVLKFPLDSAPEGINATAIIRLKDVAQTGFDKMYLVMTIENDEIEGVHTYESIPLSECSSEDGFLTVSKNVSLIDLPKGGWEIRTYIHNPKAILIEYEDLELSVKY